MRAIRTVSLSIFQIKFRDDTAIKIVESRGPLLKTNINSIVVRFTSSLFAMKLVWAQFIGPP